MVRCGAVQGCWVVCLGPDGSRVPALEALWRPDFSKVTRTRVPRLEGRSLGVGCDEGLRGSGELQERTGGGCRRPGPSQRQEMPSPAVKLPELRGLCRLGRQPGQGEPEVPGCGCAGSGETLHPRQDPGEPQFSASWKQMLWGEGRA